MAYDWSHFEWRSWNEQMAAPTQEEKRELLERHFLLGKLSRRGIEALLAHARVERYPAGREIFAKGSPGRSMMAVLRGTVKISSPSVAGKEIVLNIIAAGEIFGEIALLDGEERTADATAMTDCELLVIDRRDFMPLLEDNPEVAGMLLKILCRRLRQTSAQVEDVLFRHLESRIAKALLNLAHSVGEHAASGRTLGVHLSQQELGNIVGSSRESVNRQLQLWHKAGLVELAKGTIVIRDQMALERLV
jgi:CRP/FNR family transcriptional regulator, cyclic AMP receptor protein